MMLKLRNHSRSPESWLSDLSRAHVRDKISGSSSKTLFDSQM